ncbi:hypothetical protein D1164_20550 [Mariniphaga sediminis]|uniref:Uncharacterized protein n=1 Tax=Mariniphaga sediminis TaxID=1628158 RepID=A0A399CTJ8_9BACT|nr:hypothetical protein [Mariniphaga sediminis]RIH63245.1 hypothetical protein D1164_20550 [Mariniphaga sediminis]
MARVCEERSDAAAPRLPGELATKGPPFADADLQSLPQPPELKIKILTALKNDSNDLVCFCKTKHGLQIRATGEDCPLKQNIL